MELWRTGAGGLAWACTVVEARTPAGYEISDMDPAVADAEFMGALSGALARPQNVITPLKDGLSVVTVRPGDAGHLAAALRAVPGAMISKGK